jgi:hypothetical protein
VKSVGPPVAFAELLGRPMGGVARISLRHERRSAFRWMGVLEVVLLVFFFVCIVPLMLLAMLLGGNAPAGDIDLDGHRGRDRFTRYWHELVLTIYGADGRPLAELAHVPKTRDEGDAIVAAILAAAAREGVVIVETIGAQEVVEVWYGGRALLTHPDHLDVPGAIAALARSTIAVEDNAGTITLRRTAPARDEWVGWAILGLLTLFFPLLLFKGPQRAWRLARWDTKGVPPGEHVMVLHPDRIEYGFSRNGESIDRSVVDLRHLLGVSYSATLGYDGDCARRPPHLRLIGRHGTTELPFTLPDADGAAMRDVLVGGLLHVRTLNPTLELPGLHIGATRCPFCGTLYELQPGTRCPSCGAWAGSLLPGA